MATATSTGEIRPQSPTSEIHWVKESTVVKRIRRKLAARNHSLLITREGTAARRELGQFAVLDSDGHPLQTHADLAALGRFLNVLAANEAIEEPIHKGWLFYVARQTRVFVNGAEANYARPVTREYKSESAALKAAAHIADRDSLLICSIDASIRESRHDA